MAEQNMTPRNMRRTTMLSLVIVVLLAAAALIVGVTAKYITAIPSAYKQADAAEFYFLTDLPENDLSTPYPVYDGTIDFTVKNHDSINISEKQILYSVSIERVSDGAVTDCATSPLAGNTESEEEITFTVEQDGDYIATVTASAPYAKTITLYFRVNTHYADLYYTVTKHDGWLELDIYTGESNEDITVSYGSLQPDNTISLTADWKAGTNKSGVLTGLQAHSHYRLIFFGTYAGDPPFALTQNT